MYDFEIERGWGKSVFCLVGVVALSSQLCLSAATLSLAGVAEGFQIVLPTSVPATNLNITASLSGLGGRPDVAFSMESHGVVLQRLTSAAPYAVTFSGLSIGKYFLLAQVVTATSVTADVSFEIAASSLQPANDLWSQASTIANLGATVFGTNTWATAETNEPVHADNGAARSVWWSWQPSVSSTVTVTTDGSDFDTVLAVYTGTNVSALSLVSANDDAGFTNRTCQVSFPALAGTKYHIAVDGAVSADDATSSGQVHLRVSAATPPGISVVSPTNGLIFRSVFVPTNVLASASINDAVGIEHVEFALDGGTISRRGVLLPPYQWSLTNLPSGDYLLTVSVRNTLGLITEAHASFSVVSLASELVFVDAPATPAGFHFAVTGLKGRTNELQWATNLPAWNRLALWTNFDGALLVTDSNSSQFNTRYYRVLSE